MEYSTARAYYFREHSDHNDTQFYHIYHSPEREGYFAELFAKYGVIDIMGNKIEVGDKIAYSISVDRSALLFIYEVLEVKENGKLKAQAIDAPNRWRTPTRASSLTFPESRALKIM